MHWYRSDLKQRAKEVLRSSYWLAFVVSIVLGVVAGGANLSVTSRSNLNFGPGEASYNWKLVPDDGTALDRAMAALQPFIPFLIAGGVLLMLVGFAFKALVFSPLEMGCRRFFLESTQERFHMGDMGYAFECGHYKNIVATLLLRDIFLTLWTLLLVIPGIIKSYAYRMVPYLLAENPGLVPKRAFELSNEMTRGHKFAMFVLDLSFIGWYLLGGLACGLGILFVNPYFNSTQAQLYVVLRANAIDTGLTTLGELAGGESY